LRFFQLFVFRQRAAKGRACRTYGRLDSKEGGSVMPNLLGIGLGYGTFAVLVILIVCLWAVPF
jgi:hypothetical protein